MGFKEGFLKMLTHEDIQELKKVFDDRYVMQADCDATQKSLNSKLANDDKRLDLLNQKMTAALWLVTTIAGGIIALVVKAYLGG